MRHVKFLLEPTLLWVCYILHCSKHCIACICSSHLKMCPQLQMGYTMYSSFSTPSKCCADSMALKELGRFLRACSDTNRDLFMTRSAELMVSSEEAWRARNWKRLCIRSRRDSLLPASAKKAGSGCHAAFCTRSHHTPPSAPFPGILLFISSHSSSDR